MDNLPTEDTPQRRDFTVSAGYSLMFRQAAAVRNAIPQSAISRRFDLRRDGLGGDRAGAARDDEQA
jgi:hypothetical protein